MPQELELKLKVPPTAADTVARLGWLRELTSGPMRRERIVSVYFDTAKGKLRERGLTLRVRRKGKRRVQTIKALPNGVGGALGRSEWEKEVAGDTPDLELAKGTALEPLATKKLKRKLKPLFETVIDRTTLPVHCGSAELELAIDRGHIRARGRRDREPISELELEMKRGDASEFAGLAQQLARSIPAAYAPRSKAERGYALSADAAHHAVGAEDVALDPRMSVGDAFQAIGFACLHHAIANESAIRSGDLEGVHQMRVGLRRLRAAISIFKPLIEGPQTEAIKAELKWLTDQLGAARELDVLIKERVHPLQRAAPVAAEAGVLERDLDAKRDAAIAKAQAALEGERFRALGLRTALWLADGAWRRSRSPRIAACREERVIVFARRILAKRLKKILKRSRSLERLDARRRHKLRIAIKKLRYALEFFAHLFGGGKRAARRKRLGKLLKALQGALGTLNDIEVHKGFARKVARGAGVRSQTRKALAMGFIAGQEQKQAAACIAAAGEAAERLSGLRGFWK